jgi:SAM-dependent methyltransferase
MHDTALRTGEAFFKCYGFPSCRVLDVGSLDVNGTLKPFLPEGSKYIGVDLSYGPNVDKVLDNPGEFPFPSEAFDLVVSTSCLEHDPMFWITFAEMARVVNLSGFVYVSVPSNGPYHGHPGDCWRFYPDSTAALSKWAHKCGYFLDVIESFLMSPSSIGWIDQVMIFGKRPTPPRKTVRGYLLGNIS